MTMLALNPGSSPVECGPVRLAAAAARLVAAFERRG